MLPENGPYNYDSSMPWVWSDCKLVLRRTNPDNGAEESYQNLQAEVELESQDIQEPFLPEFVFQKELQFNPKKGFRCRKDSPLPPLRVKLQKNYLDLLHEDEQTIMIYCDLTIAYPRRKDTHFYLEQIQTVGQKRKIFSQAGEVLFDSIILKQSSLKKMNSKFSFLVTICASSIEENRIILKTLISTAFYSQPRKIQKRNRFMHQISTMKLLSPVKFLKPISCLNTPSVRQHSINQFIQIIKEMNKKSHSLVKLHPFYLLYHLIDMIQVYYHSEEVQDLNQMLERLCPFLEDEKSRETGKNITNKYELKKTKKIRKFNQNGQIKKKSKHQHNFYIQLKNYRVPESHLILITFHHSILQCILNEIQRQKSLNQQSLFEQEIQKQAIQFTKMFKKWKIFQFKVDLFRKESIETFWKDIQKKYVYETYKKHYQLLQTKFSKNDKNFAENQKMTDDIK